MKTQLIGQRAIRKINRTLKEKGLVAKHFQQTAQNVQYDKDLRVFRQKRFISNKRRNESRQKQFLRKEQLYRSGQIQTSDSENNQMEYREEISQHQEGQPSALQKCKMLLQKNQIQALRMRDQLRETQRMNGQLQREILLLRQEKIQEKELNAKLTREFISLRDHYDNICHLFQREKSLREIIQKEKDQSSFRKKQVQRLLKEQRLVNKDNQNKIAQLYEKMFTIEQRLKMEQTMNKNVQRQRDQLIFQKKEVQRRLKEQRQLSKDHQNKIAQYCEKMDLLNSKIAIITYQLSRERILTNLLQKTTWNVQNQRDLYKYQKDTAQKLLQQKSQLQKNKQKYLAQLREGMQALSTVFENSKEEKVIMRHHNQKFWNNQKKGLLITIKQRSEPRRQDLSQLLKQEEQQRDLRQSSGLQYRIVVNQKDSEQNYFDHSHGK